MTRQVTIDSCLQENGVLIVWREVRDMSWTETYRIWTGPNRAKAYQQVAAQQQGFGHLVRSR
ncbi:hypothetical protein CERSUDRAFT_115634 [Gelatoporia subvermispora B]|uniref:Uncharacterized protein n=1 Tax=Ceriporiopsis subvermispora (strain B) TaxID=914234 RepID=M2RCR9_CERS8|nr:hypothetical protein CERSUDRAFT_115634 [Gelatoporia subvermispora B]